MKILKNLSFGLVLTYLVIHFICEFKFYILEGEVTCELWVLKQYEFVILFLTIPCVLIYLYRRLK